MRNKHIFEQNRNKNPLKQKDTASDKTELIKKMKSIQKSHKNFNQEEKMKSRMWITRSFIENKGN